MYPIFSKSNELHEQNQQERFSKDIHTEFEKKWTNNAVNRLELKLTDTSESKIKRRLSQSSISSNSKSTNWVLSSLKTTKTPAFGPTMEKLSLASFSSPYLLLKEPSEASISKDREEVKLIIMDEIPEDHIVSLYRFLNFSGLIWLKCIDGIWRRCEASHYFNQEKLSVLKISIPLEENCFNGVVDISKCCGIKLCELDRNNDKFSFIIDRGSKGNIEMACESLPEASKWVEIIEKYIPCVPKIYVTLLEAKIEEEIAEKNLAKDQIRKLTEYIAQRDDQLQKLDSALQDHLNQIHMRDTQIAFLKREISVLKEQESKMTSVSRMNENLSNFSTLLENMNSKIEFVNSSMTDLSGNIGSQYKELNNSIKDSILRFGDSYSKMDQSQSQIIGKIEAMHKTCKKDYSAIIKAINDCGEIYGKDFLSGEKTRLETEISHLQEEMYKKASALDNLESHIHSLSKRKTELYEDIQSLQMALQHDK